MAEQVPAPLPSFQFSFAADLNAPGTARRALEGSIRGIEGDLLERSGLALTEVVTNSVQHAGLEPTHDILMQVSLPPELLRIEVTDDGPGFVPLPASSKPDEAPGGWGLWLVDQLADRWGVDPSHSTRVWLEFER
jgi:anti-sigma regulatory factor (Ser/Thr protein kinase)